MSEVRPAADLPVAVAAPVASPLAGPARRANLLGAFGAAGYLRCDGVVLAVLSCDAIRLPCGIVLATSAAELPVDSLLAPGTRVVVGDGCVRAGGVRLVAARTWVPPTIRGGEVVDVAQLRAAALMLPAPTLPVETAALSAALTRAPAALDDAVQALVGRGPGLTPSGDDVLAGALLAACAFADTDRALHSAVMRHLTGRTTDLSAALVRHAAEGHAAPQVLGLVEASAARGRTPDGESVSHAMHAVLAVGATSGADLATGIVAGASAAAGLAA